MTKEFFEKGKKIAKWADNNMTKDEALKMAILQFERINKEYDCTEIIDICKEALEQPTLTYEDGFAHGYEAHRAEQALEQPAQKVKVLYEKDGIQTCEILPAPSWQGLSDDERFIIVQNADWDNPYDIAELIEQALKEKNNAMQ